jgi:hypothetical protein
MTCDVMDPLRATPEHGGTSTKEPFMSLSSGLVLALYAVAVAWTARLATLPLPLIATFAIGNVGWAVACAGLLASGAVQPSPLGVAWIAAQAATVLVLAGLQGQGLRTGRTPSASW